MSKTLVLTCSNNLSQQDVKVKETKKPNGTSVTFLPDYERFGEKNLPKANVDALMFDMLHVSMAYPGINFNINGKKIGAKSLKDYAKMYERGEQSEFVEEMGIKIVVLPNELDNFKFVHFINGLNVSNGGDPFDYVADNIVDRIHEKLVKKYSGIKKGDIKNKLHLVVLYDGMNNPRFADQIKSRCTTKYSSFKTQIGEINFDKFVAKILKNQAIMDPITEVYKIKEEFNKRKELDKFEKEVQKIKVPKYIPAEKKNEYLFLEEGDSAQGLLANVLGREVYGHFPLKGKPVNVLETQMANIMSNPEMKFIFAILGLKNETSDYDNVCIAADADLDGTSIAGLLIVFFFRFAPWMLKEGRIKLLRTPNMIVRKGGKVHKYFFNISDYNTWVEENGGLKGLKAQYIKGLGTNKAPELQEIFEVGGGVENFMETLEYDEQTAQDIESWFSSKTSDTRKELQAGFSFNISDL